jgi:KilA-N domain
MNSSSIIKSYKGRPIRIRSDRFVCLTDMATAYGKQSSDWTRLKKTHSLELALSAKTGIPREQLIEITVVENVSSTWAHPKLAIQFAQWCSDDFALQVSDWIDELMTYGKVSISPPEQPPLSLMQQISAMALTIHDRDVQIELIKQQQALESTRIDELTEVIHQHDSEIERLFSPNGDYFSVVGYAKSRKLSIGLKTASAIGKKCTAYCQDKGIPVEKLKDARWGEVGSYPEMVIEMFM